VVLAPVRVDLVMATTGLLRTLWGHVKLPLDRFTYGMVFSGGVAFMRYWFST
jgi:hypothetical protein